MKRFTKVMAVFAALVLALAFVGCKNDTSDSTKKSDSLVTPDNDSTSDDDSASNGGPSSSTQKQIVSEWESVVSETSITSQVNVLTFFSDDTFEVVTVSKNTLLTDDVKVNADEGTYDGDPSKDGKIKMTFTKAASLKGLIGEEKEYDIENGQLTISAVPGYKFTRK